MEIKIDLKEILHDEYGGSENLTESIHRQIVQKLTASLSQGIQNKVDEEIAKLIDEQIKKNVECQMPSLFTELIDKEYEIIGSYGERGKKTTMRNQLIKSLTDNMVYKAGTYASDKNYFTQNVDAIMKQKIDEFKSQFDTHVNETFTKEAFKYAIKKVGAKLGV